jgi:hypothetical protein
MTIQRRFDSPIAASLTNKNTVRAATTADITLSGTQTIDDVALVVGDRVLVKDQVALAENGVYIVDSGIWERASDANSGSSHVGLIVAVGSEGTTNPKTQWMQVTAGEIVLGTSDIVFESINAGGGGGGSGDVVGPASATDNAITRFNGTTGKLVQNSGATVDDTGKVTASAFNASGLTASAVVVTDASKNLESSAVTSTELGYLSGADSNIQDQLDGKQGIVSGVSDTEIGYLDGVTSAIQTQLDGKQPLDADLTALAGVSASGMLARTGAGTAAARTITGTANEISVSNGDGVSGNPTLSLATGIDPAKLADGSVSATEFQYISTLSSNAQTQLDAKLDKAGGTMTGALVLAGDPDSALKAATKQYVDSVAAGLDIKPSVLVATTEDITLSGEQTIDGVLTSTSRVLVKNQTAQEENGIYVSAAGSWSRAADMDAWAEVPGAFCFVEQGSTFGDCGFVCTADIGGTIGVTAITFAQFSGIGTFQPLDSTLTALAAYNTNGLLTQTAADTFVGRTITGTSNEISVSNGDGVSGNPTLSLPSEIDLSSKVLKVPNGTSPTVDAAGEIAIDTDADGDLIDQGLIVYHDGVQKMYAVAVDTLPSTDDHVLAYDATADKFVFQAQSGGGGSAATPSVAGVVTNYTPVKKSGVNTVSSANYTMLETDGYSVDQFSTAETNRTFTLGTEADNAGRFITVAKTDTGAGFVIPSAPAGFLSPFNTHTDILNINTRGAGYSFYCNGTNWIPISYPFSSNNYLSSWTFNGSGGNTGNVTVIVSKYAGLVRIMIPVLSATSGTGSTTLTFGTSIGTAYRPNSEQWFPITIVDNGGVEANWGALKITTGGSLLITRDPAGTAWTDASTCGTSRAITITYFKST